MIQCPTLLFAVHMTMSSTSGIPNFSWFYYVNWLSFIDLSVFGSRLQGSPFL